MSTWNLEEGLSLVRAIQPGAKGYGFHVALAGGVLNKGTSDKDIDLVFLPFNNKKYPEDLTGMMEWLTKMWGIPVPIESYEYEPISREELQTTKGEARADFFVLQNGEGNFYYARKVESTGSCYRSKWKFTRDGDRIEIFVV